MYTNNSYILYLNGCFGIHRNYRYSLFSILLLLLLLIILLFFSIIVIILLLLLILFYFLFKDCSFYDLTKFIP